jgi:hypothetical protein
MKGICSPLCKIILLFSYVVVAFIGMWPLKESGVPLISIIYLFFVVASTLLYSLHRRDLEGVVLFLISIIPIFGVPAVALSDPSPRSIGILVLFVALGVINTVIHRAKAPKGR